MLHKRFEDRSHRRGIVSVLVSGFGEIALTLGLVLLMFVAWQLWWTNLEASQVQNKAIMEVSQAWQGNLGEITHEEVWGILYVPRFGDSYAKPIAEGVTPDVLDTTGIGHYPDTQVPGQMGNVGLAGHRQTHGQVFWDMDKLIPGDSAYVQTEQGIYTYRYKSTEIVYPSQSEVLYPVPGESGTKPTRNLLTLTTCHPPFTTNMRMVVQLEQSGFTPSAESPPPAIRSIVQTTTSLEVEK